MNLKEAYNVLGIQPTSTPEEVKKQYKKLSKAWHPDVNKDPGAEDKFKQINQAYKLVQEGPDAEPDIAWNPFVGFHNIKQRPFSNIEVQTTLAFRDAVQGCKVDVKYSRQTKCNSCHGNGHKSVNNGCKTCGGRGQLVQKVAQRGGHSINIAPCPDCRGRANTVSCVDCGASGVVDTETCVNVSIPPAVSDGNVLRLQGMGHYTSSIMGMMDTYTDAFLHIRVTPDPGLRLEGKDVVSDTTLSMLEALQGCVKHIHTIDGDRELTIPSKIRNKEEIDIQVGDTKHIKHRIIVYVAYPENVNELVNFLSKESL